MLLSPSQVLLRYGSDPNYENIHGHVALHLAWDSWLKEINHPVFKAIKLNTAVQLITELLQYGAEPDCAMHNGKTPLHLAAGWGHAMICALLLRVRWLGHRERCDSAGSGNMAEDNEVVGFMATACCWLHNVGLVLCMTLDVNRLLLNCSTKLPRICETAQVRHRWTWPRSEGTHMPPTLTYDYADHPGIQLCRPP